MTQCFLPLTSSSSKYDWGEHHEGLAWIPSSEEISPTKLPQLYPTGEPLPPHGGIQRLDSMISEVLSNFDDSIISFFFFF